MKLSKTLHEMNNMKTRTFTAIAVLAATAFPLCAATFNSGSTGSNGPINLGGFRQSATLTVPPDGVFHFTTIDIGCDSSLYLNPNALNTPVYFLCTGDVNITGRIYINGAGGAGRLGGTAGPGGFSGGMGGIAGGRTAGGDGAGPGGGKTPNGRSGGAFAYQANANTNSYGNALLYPLIGGSGGAGKDAGAGGYAGGGGGGAILIASNTKITFGTCGYNPHGIVATGGHGTYGGNYPIGGGGSGGAIRLVAPVVAGAGTLDTSGGLGGNCCAYPDAGSQGRIRIDCLDDFSYRTLTLIGSFTRGSQMWVFQPNTLRLDVIEAAGQPIPFGTTNAAYVSLEFNANTNQLVKLRAENFTNDLPVRIAVTPDTGPSLTFDGVIPSTAGPVTNSFNVVIPAGTVSRIDAWTR